MGVLYSDFAMLPPCCWADVEVAAGDEMQGVRHAVDRALCPERSYTVREGATLCGIAVTSVNATRNLKTWPTCEQCDALWRERVGQKTFKELKQIPAKERRRHRLLAAAA